MASEGAPAVQGEAAASPGVPDGAVGHVEIPAPDLEAARAFYTRVFGWRVRDVPGMEGFALYDDGGFGGAFTAARPVTEGGIRPYVQVEDIETTLGAVVAAGGAVVRPRTPIGGGHGAVAQLRDPNGNVIGLWSRH